MPRDALMSALLLPRETYHMLAEFPSLPGNPLGNAGDFADSIDAAADAAAECEDEGRRWRCFLLRLRADQSVQECTEVTDAVAAVLASRVRRIA